MNKTSNGLLTFCKNCGVYHFAFGNLNFDFTKEELMQFRDYIFSIDGEYFNRLNQHMSSARKIILPTQLKGFKFCLTLDELNEMKKILSGTQINEKRISFPETDYKFSLN